MTDQEIINLINGLQGQIDDLRGLVLSYRQKLRLNNALQGEKTYYVVPGATGPTGPATKKLVYKDGILTSET